MQRLLLKASQKDLTCRPDLGRGLCKERVWEHKKVSTPSLVEVVVGNALNLCMGQSTGRVPTWEASRHHACSQNSFHLPAPLVHAFLQGTLQAPRSHSLRQGKSASKLCFPLFPYCGIAQ